MSKPRVGRILTAEDSATRDAIHVPIMPVLAGEILFPGRKVVLGEDGRAYEPRGRKDITGIVDPFLTEAAHVDQQFYLFLKPESTYKLWHEWTHPLVDNIKGKK